jgi:uncharacterized protein YegL
MAHVDNKFCSVNMVACLETDQVLSASSKFVWGMVSVSESSLVSHSPLGVDILVALDNSASMSTDDKFGDAKKAINKMIDVVDEHTNLAMIIFNHSVHAMVPFLPCTSENKLVFKELLAGVQPAGSTDLVGALTEISNLVHKRTRVDQLEVCTSVFLFTDDKDPYPSSRKLELIKKIPIHHSWRNNFHVFGLGVDTDPILLQHIAKHFLGIYHFVAPSQISSFAEVCLSRALRIHIQDLSVTIKCRDGCRLINWFAPYDVTEVEKVKKYVFRLGSISSTETKTVVFRLSLRDFGKCDIVHSLASIEANYRMIRGPESIHANLSILRVTNPRPVSRPLHLQYHFDRIQAIQVFSDIVRSEALRSSCPRTSDILDRAMRSIKDTDVIEDLRECKLSLDIHVVCSLLSSYLTESMLNFKRVILRPEVCYTNYVEEHK